MFDWHFRRGRSEALCSIHCISPDLLLSIKCEADMSMEQLQFILGAQFLLNVLYVSFKSFIKERERGNPLILVPWHSSCLPLP